MTIPASNDNHPGIPKARSFFLTVLPMYILGHCAHHLLTALPMPLLPFIRSEFGLDYTHAAFVTSSFAIAAGFGQLPAGWLADKIGATIPLLMGILGVAVFGIFIGTSQTYIMLLILMMLMGLMSGGYHPAATPMISNSVPPAQRGRALGWHLIGGNVAFFFGPIVAGVIAGFWGWRGAFICLAIPTGIIGVVFLAFLKSGSSKVHAEQLKKEHGEEQPPPPGNIRRLVAFLTMTVLAGGAGMSVMAFFTLYAVDILGLTEANAAKILSLIFVSGLYAGPIGGWLSDKFGRVPIIVICGVVDGLMIFALPRVQWGFLFFLVLFAMGLVLALRMPVTEAFLIGQTAPRYRSRVFALYYFTMQYTGAVFAPFMGKLVDLWGFTRCFTISAIIVVVVTLGTMPFLAGSRN